MSSTDPALADADDREDLAREFWREHLVPAAAALRARGQEFFATGPDDSVASYYVRSDENDVVQQYTPADHAALLRSRWQGQGLAELARIAEPLCTLAEALQPDEQQAGDVSPLIYVMF
jgi:hypothetical protein